MMGYLSLGQHEKELSFLVTSSLGLGPGNGNQLTKHRSQWFIEIYTVYNIVVRELPPPPLVILLVQLRECTDDSHKHS